MFPSGTSRDKACNVLTKCIAQLMSDKYNLPQISLIPDQGSASLL